MFARITPAGHVAIYESYFDKVKKTSRQRTVKSLGSVKALKEKGIEDPLSYAQSLIPELVEQRKKEEANKAQKQSDYEKIGVVSPTKNMGHYFLRAIDNDLGLKEAIYFFGRDAVSKKANIADILQDLVVCRAIEPSSKKKTFKQVLPTLKDEIDYSLDDVYSSLEFLGANYQRICAWYRQALLERYKVDSSRVYFDCTNYYFEIDKTDGFREKGPSKENRKDPIVGMGLLLDANLMPINMNIYPGNQSEKPKIKEVIDELKRDIPDSGRTVRVADKGLNCAANIFDALQTGDGYIFSKSIKAQSEKERLWALDQTGFRVHADALTGEIIGSIKSVVDTFSYTIPGTNKTVSVKEKRIVSLNYALRKKQLQEIAKMVDKAKNLCLSRAKKAEFGESARFVDFKAKGKEDEELEVGLSLNEKAIQKAKACAGYNMLVTSEVDMDDMKLYHTYHQLWRIEETFRALKSYLDARPVFLQKPNSIKGHFLVCYLSILLTRVLQFYHLDKHFGTSELFEFIRGFKVLEVSPRTYMNLSCQTNVGNYIAKHTRIKVDKAVFTGQEIKAIKELKRRNLPRPSKA